MGEERLILLLFGRWGAWEGGLRAGSLWSRSRHTSVMQGGDGGGGRVGGGGRGGFPLLIENKIDHGSSAVLPGGCGHR